MQTSISHALSRKLANVGIVCAALVVIDHSIVNAPSGSLFWWFTQCLSQGFCQIAVPFFFVVSGFLLVAHRNEVGWWKCEVRKRVKSLLVPFFIWGVLGSLCLTIWLSPVGVTEWGRGVLMHLGIYPFSLPTNTPLWFLRSLFFLVVMSPFLFWCVRRFRWLTLVFWYGLSIVLSVVLKSFPEWNNFCGNFIPLKWGCFWFSLGAFLREQPMALPRRNFYLLALAIGSSLVVASKYLLLQNVSLAPLLQKISIPFLLASLWGCFPDFHWTSVVTSLAFPIYLVHMPLIMLARENYQMTGFFGYCFCIAIGLLGSVIIASVLRRWLPRFASVVFGGR